MAEAIGEDERWILNTRADPDPFLLAALDDPQRWVAAHVLLTERHMAELGQRPDAPLRYRWGTSNYNGMRADMSYRGVVIIDEKQRTEIRAFWITLLQSHD
jgi:hypothetical protein